MNYLKVIGILGFGVLFGCGASDESSARGGTFDSPGAIGDENHGGDGGGSGTGGGAPQEPFIPENEVEVNLQVPQAGDTHVFVVSTGLDAVVRIDGVSLDVDLIEVGGVPTEMRTLGSENSLVVLNTGTRDFSVVRAVGGGEETVTTLDAPSAVNRMEVADNGLFGVAWFDPEVGGLGDLQTVLVLRLADGMEAVFSVGVGFAPRSVSFVGATAYVVTDDGLSIIDMAALDGPSFEPPITAVDDPFAKQVDREILVTPDGTRAVVRRGGYAEIRVVDLASKEVTLVELDGLPTDVDLVADGSEALIVLREQAKLLRMPLNDPQGYETIDLSGTPAGLATLTPDGKSALLFSTLPGNEWVAILELATGDVRALPLKKGVEAIAPAPDGKTALIIHTRDEGSEEEDNLERQIDQAYGYSVLDLATGFAKLVLLETPARGYAITPDSKRAYVLVPNGAGHTVDAVDLTAMLVTIIPMGSPPEHAVFLPSAGRMAVSQDHPVGRITFIDTTSGKSETVTGFELNALIE